MRYTYSQDWLCRRIVSESRDAVIFADKDGLIRLWNAGAEAMFGYRAAEMEGRSFDLIIPEALRTRHNEGFRRVMASGESRYAAELLAVPGLRKDGVRISLEFTITLIKDDEGEVLGAVAILRDVTARWQRDQELKKRLAALAGQGRAGQGRGAGARRLTRKISAPSRDGDFFIGCPLRTNGGPRGPTPPVSLPPAMVPDIFSVRS